MLRSSALFVVVSLVVSRLSLGNTQSDFDMGSNGFPMGSGDVPMGSDNQPGPGSNDAFPTGPDGGGGSGSGGNGQPGPDDHFGFSGDFWGSPSNYPDEGDYASFAAFGDSYYDDSPFDKGAFAGDNTGQWAAGDSGFAWDLPTDDLGDEFRFPDEDLYTPDLDMFFDGYEAYDLGDYVYDDYPAFHFDTMWDPAQPPLLEQDSKPVVVVAEQGVDVSMKGVGIKTNMNNAQLKKAKVPVVARVVAKKGDVNVGPVSVDAKNIEPKENLVLTRFESKDGTVNGKVELKKVVFKNRAYKLIRRRKRDGSSSDTVVNANNKCDTFKVVNRPSKDKKSVDVLLKRRRITKRDCQQDAKMCSCTAKSKATDGSSAASTTMPPRFTTVAIVVMSTLLAVWFA